MRVAIVHDMLTVYGGAERVLEAMLEIYPRADLYTSVYDLDSFPPNSLIGGRGDPKRAVGETPGRGKLFGFSTRSVPGGVVKAFSLFYPLVFENWDLSNYDVVISSSSNFAKGVIVPPGVLHIAYIHTPPRFLYGYQTESNWRKKRVIGALLKPIDSMLRVWDYQAAQRADYVLTNSKIVAKRVEKYYRREATVIYPPVEMVERVGEGVSPSGETGTDSIGLNLDGGGDGGVKIAKNGKYFLVVSRLSKYKNIDLVIEAFSRLPGERLKIVGTGPEEKDLRSKILDLRLEGKAELLGFVGDSELIGLYQDATALICPTEEEDFGITPVEAMAVGTPVVALRSGGYLETVVEGKTGVFFDQPTPQSLVEVLQNFDPNSFDSPTIRTHAQKFSKSRFQEQMIQFLYARASRGGNN